jgi:eukaryotic-like serine/threonine-protein kinase
LERKAEDAMKLPLISARQWRQLGELFDRLAAQAPGTRNLDALDCDPMVRRVLAEMLASSDSDDPFVLDRTIQGIAGQAWDDADQGWLEGDYAGHCFGPWQAVETIARGGMSLILRGQRVDGQFDKEVAIKLLPGHNDATWQRPLSEEIRILARLEHPGIARLIDGGTDPDGVRYLVMEYVRGSTLNEFCRALDGEQKLALFDQVLAAVAFAHRQLVAHCDIKPANILVSDEGQVRLVDFGIANLIDRSAKHVSSHCGWFCSPGYAAPEQLRGELPGIPQDVFSLGAVLYELITGHRLRDNRTATRHWLGLDHGPEQIIAPRQHNRDIDRDLEAICLCALAEDSADRYGTVDALREDLARRRRHLPVTARGNGRMYRVGKFVRRNRWGLIGAGAVAGMALAGAIGIHWQAQEARDQASQAHASAERALLESRRAQASRDFLVQLFEASDPDVSGGAALTARELLDTGEFQIQTAFRATPGLRAEMLILIGNLYRRLGEAELAHRTLQEGLALATDQGQTDLIVAALHGIGALESQAGRHQTALAALQRAEALLVESGQVPGPAHAELLGPLLTALGHVHGFDQAVEHGYSVLAGAQTHYDLQPVTHHDYLVAMGSVLLATEQLQQAEAMLRKAMTLNLAEGDTPSRRWKTHAVLLHVAGRMGDIESALILAQQAAELAEEAFPPGHFTRAEALVNLAISLCFAGRLAEAEEQLNQAMAIFRSRGVDDNHPLMGMVHSAFGLVLLHAERHAEARDHLEQARRLASEDSGRDPLRYLMATGNLALALARLGSFTDAETMASAALTGASALLPDDHFRLGWFQAVLAEVRLTRGDHDQALLLVDQALEHFRRIDFDEPVVNLYLRVLRARALAAAGQIAPARSAFEQALEFGRSAGSNAALEWPRSLAAYVEFLVDTGAADARQQAQLAHDHLQLEFGDEHPATANLQQLIERL